MKSEDRKNKIHQITQGNVYSSDGKGKRLRYRGEVRTFAEYEIPMDFLVYNVENGRIASLVKSFEREHSSLNPESEGDAKRIAQFLFDSNDIANKNTIKSLADNGQLESGIITSDGVIVDGNRRASLMIKILTDEKSTPEQKAKCEKFRAVVLPEDADEKEILRLETTFQMGADEKVGYNAIEKYLHARDMLDKGFSQADISDYMNLGSVSKVQELIDVVGLIDDYLDYYEYTGIYTRLPRGFEDDLLKLNTAVKKIRSGRISWIPTDKLDEVENDLKCICFDFIRLNAKSQEGFEYRAIAATSKNNFLENEDVWNKFVSDWQNATGYIEEESIDSVLSTSKSVGDSERLLEQRDNKWREKVEDTLMDGFSEAKNTIDNKKEKEKPSVLLRRAINALEQVDSQYLSVSNDKQSLSEQLEEISKICNNLKESLQQE